MSLNSCSCVLVSLQTPGQDQFRMCLLHTCAVWPSTKGENHTITMQMVTTNPPSPTSAFSVAHQPFVSLFIDYQKKKKNCQHPSKSLSTSFSADALQEPRSLGINQLGLCVATAWHSQSGLVVLINNFTEHRHRKRPLCVQGGPWKKTKLLYFVWTQTKYEHCSSHKNVVKTKCPLLLGYVNDSCSFTNYNFSLA